MKIFASFPQVNLLPGSMFTGFLRKIQEYNLCSEVYNKTHNKKNIDE